MIHIDGTYGEGGGQILRTALALSLLTGKPFRLSAIRAGRKTPGLMAQHLQSVHAAAAVGQARVTGAEKGSQNLIFEPAGICSGEFRFDIGTAGSTSLVLQTIFQPLAFSARPSQVTITGGTHVPWSPCFHYLDRHWLPFLKTIGMAADLDLVRSGFYPRGGGCIRASIRPAQTLSSLQLVQRGALEGVRILSAAANLDPGITERQCRRAEERLAHLGFDGINTETAVLEGSGKGTLLLLVAKFEQSRCCYYALGERGKPAERVADEAVEALEDFLAGDGAIDEYLADQLLLPLVFASGSSALRTARITAHLVTNAWVIRQFLPAAIIIEGEVGAPGTVRIGGISRQF